MTAFLFGSIHTLPPGLEWQTETMRQAFEQADECWFEIDLSGGLQAEMPALMARGIDPTRSLFRRIGPADQRRLLARLAGAGMADGTAVEGMQPWMAWLLVSMLSASHGHLDPALGADMVLVARAKAEGKRIVGLESAASQIDIFADQKPDVMIRLLHQTLTRPQRPDGTGRLVQAWTDGRTDALDVLVGSSLGEMGAGLGKALLGRRNAAWAARLDAERGGGKTLFVTVGAGHLGGGDGLREALRRRGWTVERVQ